MGLRIPSTGFWVPNFFLDLQCTLKFWCMLYSSCLLCTLLCFTWTTQGNYYWFINRRKPWCILLGCIQLHMSAYCLSLTHLSSLWCVQWASPPLPNIESTLLLSSHPLCSSCHGYISQFKQDTHFINILLSQQPYFQWQCVLMITMVLLSFSVWNDIDVL